MPVPIISILLAMESVEVEQVERDIMGLLLDMPRIRAVAELCMQVKGHEGRIARCLEGELAKNKKDSKLLTAYFLLLSEILQRAHTQKQNAYIKLLWRKPKFSMELFAKLLPPCSFCLDLQRAELVINTIKSWRQTKLFTEIVLEEVFAAAQPVLKFIEEQKERKKQQETPPFSKYDECFIRQLRDIKRFPALERYYQTFTNSKDLAVRIANLQQKVQKVRRTGDRSKVEEVKSNVQSTMEYVEGILTAYHQNYRMMLKLVEEDFRRLAAKVQ